MGAWPPAPWIRPCQNCYIFAASLQHSFVICCHGLYGYWIIPSSSCFKSHKSLILICIKPVSGVCNELPVSFHQPHSNSNSLLHILLISHTLLLVYMENDQSSWPWWPSLTVHHSFTFHSMLNYLWLYHKSYLPQTAGPQTDFSLSYSSVLRYF